MKKPTLVYKAQYVSGRHLFLGPFFKTNIIQTMLTGVHCKWRIQQTKQQVIQFCVQI